MGVAQKKLGLRSFQSLVPFTNVPLWYMLLSQSRLIFLGSWLHVFVSAPHSPVENWAPCCHARGVPYRKPRGDSPEEWSDLGSWARKVPKRWLASWWGPITP